MQKILSLMIAPVFFVLVHSQTLDTNQLSQNAWVNFWPAATPFTINGSNWVYENDFRSNPFYGFLLVGPGHVVHCQDCHWYTIDPVRNKVLKLNTAVRPVRT